MKKMLLLLLLIASLLRSSAQNQAISGKVTDEAGKPLAGATVTIKGTTLSATTDENGIFHINTGPQIKPVFTISFVGYESFDYTYKGNSNFTISLHQDTRTLGDVIVIGYGEQRKRDVTGATVTVKAADIVKKPIVRVEEALQGTVPGVTVQSVNGMPGAGLAVRIRGTASINNNNDPLYVIDGQIGGDISTISPNDIESIEVLKDASATAIYGSRGSTGVVIITTKLGKENKTRIDINPWVKKEMIAKELPLMNAYQFAIATNAQYATTGQPPAFSDAQIQSFKTNPGTDWQHALQDKPWVQNYQVSVSGGSNDVKYMVSYLHLDQPGLIINQWYRTDIARANFLIKASDRLNLQFNLTGSLPHNRNTWYQGDITDPFAEAYAWDPTSPIKDANGNFILESSHAALGINPIAQETNGLNDNSSTNLTGTGILTYRIIKGLTFTSNNTYSNSSNINRQLYGPGTSTYLANSSNGFALQNTSGGHSFQNSNYFTYKGSWGDHDLTVTALYEQSSGTGYNNWSKATNLSTYSLGYYNLGLGATQNTSSGYSSQALQSYMGRVEYKFKDRYLLNGTIRDDGSSVLTQKYSVFPSAALGWIISKEDFLASSRVISFLKLRASYGVTGNQTVGAYSSIPKINVGGVENATGYPFNGNQSAVSIYTPLGGPVSTNLKWERDNQTDVGIDAVFLNGLITFTGDYYYRKVTDLLYNLTAPYYNSGQNYQINLGSLYNRGFEFNLGATPVSTRNFKWTTSGIISFNTNKLLTLNGLDNVITSNIGSAQSGISILKVGMPLGEFYGFKFLGTWKSSEAAQAAVYGNKPGDSKYLDVLGTHTINATDDRIPIGNGTPKYTFSWSNDLTYGNFTLTMLFYGSHGGQIYSGTLPYTYGGLGDARNATNAGILNVWTPQHETDVPTFSPSSNNYINSSRWVFDGSFIKLKNIALSWHVPQQWITPAKVRNLEIYVSSQNVFTITNYPGYDPEVTNMTNGITQGLETGVIPNPRSFTFGLRAGF
ncbi:SusC/RagA family TonB-linked outer membrane protein [Puia dinghuensis]|uniref:SusC/RagA family TonB-linked outer membrane protein n=1 Tax=Puia dinghuensis TaxID=1792502 RepID=A0A8J2XSS3_9BACT|nr:TonB-dependent receptor [Puia dinghuensis]GGA97246.1 SusC/RagA family TonB-linked outer membrane protein [Puia dinghuensis]